MASKFLTLDQVLREISNGFSRNLSCPVSDALRAVSKEASEWNMETVRLGIIELKKLSWNSKDILMEIPDEMADDVNLVTYATFLQNTMNDITLHYYQNDMEPLNMMRVMVDAIKAYCEFIVNIEGIIDRCSSLTQQHLADKFKRSCNA